ncbi:MAG TPA: acetylornithine transaminase [Candidatus Dormibacteraeota bacterium]|jgi:predicted acetylornithine/succinylornithine family transaminase|nr:acetylornithine transaminase [Candidatus Dormibacteraeota bacterium]
MEGLAGLESQYLMHTFRRQPVNLTRGSGCWVYDEDGKEYLDMVGGIAVNALGHGHPTLTQAITEQASDLIHVSNLYYSRPQVELARRLVELAFPSRVFFANSGAEANEAAIKLARKWGRLNRAGAFEIITAIDSFHGRTLATVTAGGKDAYSAPFGPLPGGFVHVPFNDLDAVKAATTASTAAIMIEPILGEVGVIPAAAGYLAGLRRWCDEANLLLILDEVQTGMGRTGRWFAHQHAGITPDVMTLAKALGGGVPIGACLANPRADVFEPGDHGSTFGGNPLACRTALAVIEVIESEGLIGHAAEMGELLAESLGSLELGTVRGLGLMQALVLDQPHAKEVQAAALDAGLIVNAVTERTLRFVPPLVINPAQIDQATRVLKAVAG